MYLDLSVDFNKTQIQGMVEHTLLVNNLNKTKNATNLTQVILDYQGLSISSVELVMETSQKPGKSMLLEVDSYRKHHRHHKKHHKKHPKKK